MGANVGTEWDDGDRRGCEDEGRVMSKLVIGVVLFCLLGDRLRSDCGDGRRVLSVWGWLV